MASNDLRLIGGIEFGPQHLIDRGHRVGFFEVGYVFDREVLYVVNPQDNFRVRDTIMLRAGLAF